MDNILITEGSYKEGRKDGLFKINSKFDGKLKEEKSYKEGKLDGTSKSYLLPEKWKVKETSGWGKSTGSNCHTNLTVLCGKSIITRTGSR